MSTKLEKIKIGLCGATGRMGQAILTRIHKFSNCVISKQFNSTNNLHDLNELCNNSDIIIDFSTKEILEPLISHALKYSTKLVIGTTNLTSNHFELIKTASKDLPILYSANMSLGANLLGILAKKTAQILDDTYDVEILETHHRNKKDAPSGTAIMLGRIIAEAKNLNFNESKIFDRSNNNCVRKASEIGVVSMRGGNVHGVHDINFLGDDEVIILQHQALNKNSFADGAIKSAIWLSSKPAGLYSTLDVLNI